MMCAPRKCTICTLKPFQAMVNEYFYAIALENKICKMFPPLNLVTRTEDDAKRKTRHQLGCTCGKIMFRKGNSLIVHCGSSFVLT